ncbi:hypothetical protein FE257_000142 [Aspergillus nanangensis]|uniref:Uncharacterized protein n=1 Tax=Aspergillus nanangensis TaxID=2582783 RepID=A0AAD4GZZ1_ASPNN|nr:hypothetical protein FE257_000142 [Aspergillus nanangensis]
MSLNRISYLESWVPNPASFRRSNVQSSVVDSDSDDAGYQDLPDDSLSSSFLSTFSHPETGHRLSFNPYAGPTWGQPPEPTDHRSTPTTAKLPSHPQDEPEEQATVQNVKPYTWTVLETTGAFEVSPSKRIAQVTIAVIYCFLAAGIVFGFAALKPILIAEGVYHHLCANQNDGVCYGQELRLNLMFTIAAVATNVSALPVGTILDTFGPRICGVIGSLSLIAGIILFGLARRLPFDGALFLIFRLVHDATHGWFDIPSFFALYLLVPLFILVVQLSIMPGTSYKTAGELVQQAQAHISAEADDHVDESVDHSEGERQRNDRRIHRKGVVCQIQDLLADADDDPTTTTTTTNNPNPNPHPQSPPPTNTTKDEWTTLHTRSALTQIRTPWFLLISLFTILQMLRINYFISTLRRQYTFLLTPASAKTLNATFDILLPLGGILSVPFTGTILDTAREHIILLTLVTTATLIGILNCVPHSLPAAYVTIVLFALYRPFYYTAVSDYAAKVFGFRTFGKVYGLIICLAGVGNFAQTGLDALTLGVFEGDPGPVNGILTGVTPHRVPKYSKSVDDRAPAGLFDCNSCQGSLVEESRVDNGPDNLPYSSQDPFAVVLHLTQKLALERYGYELQLDVVEPKHSFGKDLLGTTQDSVASIANLTLADIQQRLSSQGQPKNSLLDLVDMQNLESVMMSFFQLISGSVKLGDIDIKTADVPLDQLSLAFISLALLTGDLANMIEPEPLGFINLYCAMTYNTAPCIKPDDFVPDIFQPMIQSRPHLNTLIDLLLLNGKVFYGVHCVPLRQETITSLESSIGEFCSKLGQESPDGGREKDAFVAEYSALARIHMFWSRIVLRASLITSTDQWLCSLTICLRASQMILSMYFELFGPAIQELSRVYATPKEEFIHHLRTITKLPPTWRQVHRITTSILIVLYGFWKEEVSEDEAARYCAYALLLLEIQRIRWTSSLNPITATVRILAAHSGLDLRKPFEQILPLGSEAYIDILLYADQQDISDAMELGDCHNAIIDSSAPLEQHRDSLSLFGWEPDPEIFLTLMPYPDFSTLVWD